MWLRFLHLIDEKVNKFLDGVAMCGDFDWAVLNSVSLLNKITVVGILWDIGILSTEILELLSVSCLNVLGKS
jgi:hypothetical protein